MSQRLVIRLIPINIFVVCMLAGWGAIGAIRGMINTRGLPSAAETAVAGVAGAAGALQGSHPAAGAGSGSLSPVFTPEVQHWADKIVSWSAVFKLDPNLAATVMQIESCGAPGAVSGAGAQGLFQVMPFHFTAGEDTLDTKVMEKLFLSLLHWENNASNAKVGYSMPQYV